MIVASQDTRSNATQNGGWVNHNQSEKKKKKV